MLTLGGFVIVLSGYWVSPLVVKVHRSNEPCS